MKRDFIRPALKQRLQHVQALLSAADFGSEVIVGECEDTEEVLRVVMVRLFPKIQSGKASTEEIAQYFDKLQLLMRAALGEDWRFLDAWNNAFEAIQLQVEKLPTENVIRFYQQYIFLLQNHLQHA